MCFIYCNTHSLAKRLSVILYGTDEDTQNTVRNNQQSTTEYTMQIARAVEKIQRAESVEKFKDEVKKKLHFEKYQKATGSERLALFHSAIQEGWLTA